MSFVIIGFHLAVIIAFLFSAVSAVIFPNSYCFLFLNLMNFFTKALIPRSDRETFSKSLTG